jgi:transposase InsO family protein
VLKAFKEMYNQSKIRAIRSDNGSEFINEKFVDFLQNNKIKQVLSEAGKPQSNKLIERANATIKELIQKSIELVDNISNSEHRI